MNIDKAPGMPVPGKLTDYMVDENSLVDYPANDRPFLVRKGAFTPEQIEELKAQGLSPIEVSPLAYQLHQIRAQLKADFAEAIESIKQFLAPTATQKGTDPMSEQLAAEATETKALTDADWNEIQSRIDAALAPWGEKFAALEARVAACEAPASEAEMEDSAKPQEEAKAEEALAADPTAEQIKALAASNAELQAMVKNLVNQRPAGQSEKGSPAVPATQKKAVFSGSVFEKIAEMA